MNGNGHIPQSLHRASSFGTNAVVRATEGWLELFLTPHEKLTFSQWKEKIKDKSLTKHLTSPLFEYLAYKYIPDTVAPNVVTLSGFLILGHGWYLTNLYGDYYPTSCTWVAVLSIVLFFATTSMEGFHTDRIRQRTPLGELFKYSCDSCATVFLVLLTTYCLGGTSIETQWNAVQASQLILFYKHLSAFHRNAGLRYNVFTGPGDVIVVCICLLSIRGTLGLDWVLTVYESTVRNFIRHLINVGRAKEEKMEKYLDNPRQVASEIVQAFYYAMYVLAVTKTLLLRSPHGWSRFGLSSSLLMRIVPAILIHFGLEGETKVVDVVCDGFFMAVLTSDVTLAKMAGREIHPWVVLMSMAAVLSHTTILALVFVYYIAVFADLCFYMNMPLFSTCRNVYCDGVYDLCHVGHKVLFQNALAYGNRLYVGVVGDEDANNYKRPPIMTHAERCAEVQGCKAVTKVIPNAPCFGLTEEFLELHQIHVVAFGEEYLDRYPDPKDDPYYRVPREMGIAKPLPRTKGLSTSDLIRRIQKAQPSDEKKSPT
ncbi:Choline-phosphate cytidylyltransferase A [Seminavis robusta]|uniref:ethanolamine-phosphate cytidylyltransferase n=1 Tax=Seminavis robusta TaxID=568900 RepID=A0A9N8HPI2_9STRA|nr:Choline-phosphate cytidylyltransferase A [Seminavis robusta]|eukprot:Sro1093_g240350.1 Choline-phosphate cytidylyltransferase A (539) ;mRNA; f:6642-8354